MVHTRALYRRAFYTDSHTASVHLPRPDASIITPLIAACLLPRLRQLGRHFDIDLLGVGVPDIFVRESQLSGTPGAPMLGYTPLAEANHEDLERTKRTLLVETVETQLRDRRRL